MRLYPVRLNTSNQPIDFVDLDNVMRIRVQEESLVISPKDGQEIILTYANTTALWTALANFKTVLDNTTDIDEWYVTKSESGRDLDTLNLYCVVRQQLRDQSVTITMTNKAVLTYNFTTVLEAKTFADNLKIALDALPPQSMGGGVSLFKDLSDVPSLSANPGKVLSVTADGLGVYWVEPIGATGPQGPQGPIGPSGTITIGTVTTGAPGSNVIITNTGTPSAAILNITIPRGSQGLQGIQGLQGPQGIQGEPGQPGLDGSPGVKGDEGRSAKQIFIDLGYLPSGATDQQFYDYLGAQPLTVIRGGVDSSLDTLKKLADAFQEADVAEISARDQAISNAIAAASTNYLPQSSLGTTVQPYDGGLTSLASITTLGVVMATGLNTFETRSVGAAQSSFILDRQSGDIRYLAIGGTANNSSQLNGQPGSYYRDWNNLTSKPATFPPSFHVHAIGDVTDLQSILDGKQPLGNYSTVGHQHVISDITGLQAALDSKLSSADVSWANITGKPTVFPPAPHNHVVSDIANLQTILDSKQISSPVLNSVSLISTDGLLKNTAGVITSVNVGTTTAESILDRSSGDSRYYQLSSVVADSLKLGGQLPAYYLNWNNTTNRPTTLAGYGITDQVALVSGNITGSAASLTTARTIGMTGDVTWTSAPFNGSSNVTGNSTLATVNTNVGSFGSATQVASFTVDGKGRTTAAGNITITPAWSSITSKPTTVAGYGITDAVRTDAVTQSIAGVKSFTDQTWFARPTQLLSGEPTSNLGSPSLAEMALFDSQFTNKLWFYAPDRFTFEYTTDGTTWIPHSISEDQIKRLVSGAGSTVSSTINIPNGALKYRIDIKNNGTYVYLNALYSYFSTSGNNTQVHIYRKRFDGDWIQHTSSTKTVSSWPGHLYLPFNTIPWNGNSATTSHYDDVRIEFIPTWINGNNISISWLELWGGYGGGGRRTIYTWDQDQNVTFPAKITATAFVGDGTQLTNLPISAVTNLQTSLDGKLSTTNGTVGGLTIRAANTGQILDIKGGTANHAYAGFYAESAFQNVRSGYVGFGNAGKSTLYLANERTNGDIELNTLGSGKLLFNNKDLNPDLKHSKADSVIIPVGKTLVTYGPSNGISVSHLAQYKSTSGTATGAIVFKPSVNLAAVMHKLHVTAMLYNGSDDLDFTVQGYNYLGNQPYNIKVSHHGSLRPKVRWGYTPDGVWCLIIGDTDTVWSYPHVEIVNALFSQTSITSAYIEGWTSSLVTDLSTYTGITDDMTASDKSYSAFSGTSGSVAWTNVSGKLDATTSVSGLMSGADKTKLNGIAAGATTNQTDAYLLARANHTGSQAIGTITGLQTALDSKQASLGFTPPKRSVKSPSSAASEASIIAADTRSVDSLPSAYGKGFFAEFKSKATIALPGPGTYSDLLTISTYTDATGGSAHQFGFNKAAGGSFYHRVEGAADSWGAWGKVWTELNFDPATKQDSLGFTPAASTLSLTAGNGLTGGGDLSSGRTFTLGTPGAITLSSTNAVTTTSHTHSFTPGGTTAQYIRGDGTLAAFPTIPAGTVTSITAGNGLNFTTITGTGAITLGTPGSLSGSTTNAVTATSHTHALSANLAAWDAIAPSAKANAVHTHAFSEITSKPTTLAGYGITDALYNDRAGNLPELTISTGAGVAGGVGGRIYPAIDGLHIALGSGRDVVFRSDNGNMGISGDYYAQGSQPVWHAGNLNPANYVSVSAANQFTAEQRFTAVPGSGGQIRLKTNVNAADYGAIHRMDGSNYYILLTNSGNADGTWNGLRPFRINLPNGAVTMENGVTVGGGLNVASGGTSIAGGLAVTGNTTMQNVFSSEWFRVSGNHQGLYWEQFGGGIHMSDSQWIRTYGGKNFYCSAELRGYEVSTTDFMYLKDDKSKFIRGGLGAIDCSHELWGPNFVATSDGRLKGNIATITPAQGISDVLALRPVTFDWKDSGKADLGFVAQEVREVLPELVREKEDGTLAMSYGNVTATLTAALQGALQRIADLEAIVNEMRERG